MRASIENIGPIGDVAREVLSERPSLTNYEANFYRAWVEIGSCRSYGMAAGPIPFTAITEYARINDLSSFQTGVLMRVVRNIDNAWINATAAKRKRAAK